MHPRACGNKTTKKQAPGYREGRMAGVSCSPKEALEVNTREEHLDLMLQVDDCQTLNALEQECHATNHALARSVCGRMAGWQWRSRDQPLSIIL